MMKQNQKGVSLTGFLVLLAVVGFALFIGMKLFPMYQEYWGVQRALKNLANSSSQSVAEQGGVKTALIRSMRVGYVTSVEPQHIKIERGSNGTVVSIDYEVRKPLVYNLDVVGKFSAKETISSNSAE
ncbi:DUF4845 domain-containing protein [Solilutibacter tolerans]|uniref:DUF4845 domain-containing protein n=1 Tax=Solilutibacter tolerans TaxID=1604334 RepID=A0A1N6VJ46_9GAMM|nr:DUF4845 domain-containing protein [Lysobacter tolerans]SIQ77881.1 protein of unknown function [Lysobacter tolerans]